MRGLARRELLAMLIVGPLVAPLSAMATPTTIYWTDRDGATLSSNNLDGGPSTTVVSSGFNRLQDVDLDPTTSTLWFSDWGPVGSPGGQGTINTVNTDGTGVSTVLTTGDGVHQLALDPANSQLYFTQAVSYDNHQISVVGMNGLGLTPFLSGGFGGPGWFPSGLALDTANNLLYWGDPGVLNLPPNGAVNVMSSVDGTGQTILEPHVNGLGRGMALDGASNTLFLTAHDFQNPGAGGGVFAYDITNDILTQIITSVPTTGYWDIEIDPFDQRIWWTDFSNGQILSANFDGSAIVTELAGLTTPYGLALEFEAAAVPEPSSLLLLGSGLLGLAGWRWRKNRAATS